MKKNKTFSSSFSLHPCRLVYFAGEVPGQKGAEVIDQKVEKKAETLEDKQKQLKDSLQKVEQKVTELQKKVDERKDDKTFQDLLAARKLDIKAQLQDAIKKIGEIKASLEKPENSEKNTATLAEVQKVLGTVDSAVADADTLKEIDPAIDKEEDRNEFNENLAARFKVEEAARAEAFKEARAGQSESAELGKEFQLREATNLFDNIGKADGRIVGVLEQNATVKIIDAKMMSVPTKGDLVDATGYEKDSVHQWVRVEGKFKSGVNGKGPEKTFKGWIPWDLIKPEAGKVEEVKPEEVKPEEVKPEEVKPEEVKPEEVKPEEVKPEEVKPEEVKELKKEGIDKTLEDLAKLGIKITKPEQVENIDEKQVGKLKEIGEWLKKLVENKDTAPVVVEKFRKEQDGPLSEFFKDSPISQIDFAPAGLKKVDGTPSKGLEWVKDEIKPAETTPVVKTTTDDNRRSTDATQGSSRREVETVITTPVKAEAVQPKVEVKKTDESDMDRINKEFEAKQNAIKDKLVKIDTETYKVTPKGSSLTEFNIKQKDGDKVVGYIDVNAVKDPMTCSVKLVGYPTSGGELIKTFNVADTTPDNIENILKENMPKHLAALGAPKEAVTNPYEGKITSPEEIARIDGMLQKMDPIKPEDLGKQWVDENQAAAMQRLLGAKFVEQVYVVKGAKFPDDIADIMSPKEKSLEKGSKGYEMRVLLAKRQAELQKKVA